MLCEVVIIVIIEPLLHVNLFGLTYVGHLLCTATISNNFLFIGAEIDIITHNSNLFGNRMVKCSRSYLSDFKYKPTCPQLLLSNHLTPNSLAFFLMI